MASLLRISIGRLVKEREASKFQKLSSPVYRNSGRADEDLKLCPFQRVIARLMPRPAPPHSVSNGHIQVRREHKLSS